MSKFIKQNRTYIVYGASMALLLYILKSLEFRLLIINNAFEIYAGSIAVIFMSLGIWIATKIGAAKSPAQTPLPVQDFLFNDEECRNRKISKREIEVLQLMSAGHSNQEIAAELYVSLSTVKTHVSKLFDKLEVSRRTQAVEKAKQLRLLA